MKVRMRYPIAETINWMKDKREIGLIEGEIKRGEGEDKRLLIKIEKATIGGRGSYFVYYHFAGKVLNLFRTFTLCHSKAATLCGTTCPTIRSSMTRSCNGS